MVIVVDVVREPTIKNSVTLFGTINIQWSDGVGDWNILLADIYNHLTTPVNIDMPFGQVIFLYGTSCKYLKVCTWISISLAKIDLGMKHACALHNNNASC